MDSPTLEAGLAQSERFSPHPTYDSLTNAELKAELKNLTKAVVLINHLALEDDITQAIESVRNVAVELLGCERVTLFLLFEKHKELRGILSDGYLVTAKFGEGIAGHVAQTGELLNVADVYQHPLFNKKVDKQTGFRTRSLLCCAIQDGRGRRVAVLQAVNKYEGGIFSASDEMNLKLFGTHLGNAIAKAKLYENARRERERLASLHNHFKLLNSMGDLAHVVELAGKALQEVLSCENALVFIKDNPRNELWTKITPVGREPVVARVRSGEGLVGRCLQDHSTSTLITEYSGDDWLVDALQDEMAGREVKSLLVQPVCSTNSGDKLLAVVLVINKSKNTTEGDKNTDIFFTEYFNQADVDAAGLFALELGDVLAQRSLECALASALSVVASDGSAASTHQHYLASVPPSSVDSENNSVLLRSQLMNMYFQAAPGSQLTTSPPSMSSSAERFMKSKSMFPDKQRSGGTTHRLKVVRTAMDWGIGFDEDSGTDGGLPLSQNSTSSMEPLVQRFRSCAAMASPISIQRLNFPVDEPELRAQSHPGLEHCITRVCTCIEPGDSISQRPSNEHTSGPSHVTATQSLPDIPDPHDQGAQPANGVVVPNARSRLVIPSAPTAMASAFARHSVSPVVESPAGTIGSGYLHPLSLVALPSMGLCSSAVGDVQMFFAPGVLASWDYDFTSTCGEELVKMCYDMFLISGVIEHFELDVKLLRNFLSAASSHYHDVPYHNFNHVVHVMHGVWMMLQLPSLEEMLGMEDRLALLVAAVVHDLDHDGFSNNFHVNTNSELANIYNDISVMENHHCAMAFAMLRRKECALLADLDPAIVKKLRKTIVSVILCTDMSNHFQLTQDFQKHSAVYDPSVEADRLLLCKVLLHASDIGNAVRPFEVNEVMSKRVHGEFQAQAQEETNLGLPVTFSVDRSDPLQCAQVEMNFLDYVVAPLWERLAEVLPDLEPQYKQLSANRATYSALATGQAVEADPLQQSL